MRIIDAHHHFWRFDPDEYDWIDDSMSVLRRDFLPEDLAEACSAAKVDGVVSVQARQTLEETDWLLSFAETHPFIKGVVGWVPLCESDVGDVLDHYAPYRALKGVRHVVQGEAPGFMDQTDLNLGIRELTRRKLVYDLLIFEHQLEETIRFVDRHPGQSFVLDHIAKPRIRDGSIKVWSQQIRQLAAREHVTCKLSGMVTEADPGIWTEAQLLPYLEVVLDAFGPERLMLGTDWPVCLLGASYLQWVLLIRGFASALSASEQAAVLGETAWSVYQLTTPEAVA